MNRTERCQWCGMPLFSGDCYKIEKDGWYCHNVDWVVLGGTCWEQRICADFPEFLEWLEYGFECFGCVVTEEGECTCLEG